MKSSHILQQTFLSSTLFAGKKVNCWTYILSCSICHPFKKDSHGSTRCNNSVNM